jgi:hypothetical protein
MFSELCKALASLFCPKAEVRAGAIVEANTVAGDIFN